MTKSRRWKKWRTATWASKPVGAYPNCYVEIGPDDSIEVFIVPHKGAQGIGIRIPDRRLARLAAKRINECLDDTQR